MGFQRFPIKTSHLDQGYIFLPIGIYDSLIPISKSSHEISWIIYSRSCYHKRSYTSKLSIITTNNSFIRNLIGCLWFLDYDYSCIFSDPIYIYPSINRLSCKTLLQFSNHVIDFNCFGWISSFRFVSHPSR